MYCSIFPESYWLSKGKLIRILVAQGLIQETGGKIMEDVAEEYICELINEQLLRVQDEHPRRDGTQLRVPCRLQQFCLDQLKEGKFAASGLSICSDITQLISQMNSLQLTAWFLLANQNLSQHDDINELPEGLGRLESPQTLDIRWSGDLAGLSAEILNHVRLTHLKMFKKKSVLGMKLPAGIERLAELLTLTSIHAGGGTAAEVGKLIGLRRLGVMDVDEENAVELVASIIKMHGLLS
ncbi:hypothetical protein ACLB2K_050066 [Fragaria x ananassa]